MLSWKIAVIDIAIIAIIRLQIGINSNLFVVGFRGADFTSIKKLKKLNLQEDFWSWRSLEVFLRMIAVYLWSSLIVK